MAYWWVNQNQTHDHEIEGGYMWSPKTKRNGARNTFYDNMARVKPGDIVFSFFGSRIPYLGLITSHGYSSPKPDFGPAGDAWDQEGWRVDVDYRPVKNTIRPKDYIDEIRPYLPDRYSPLRKTGDGIQAVYLAYVNDGLASKLLELTGEDTNPASFEGRENLGDVKIDLEAEEDRIENLIKRDPTIDSAEKETLVKARKGQGKFRQDVILLHRRCPFTGVDDSKFLRAGHLKPWSKCENNKERIDPLNGLPLTPVADLLLDQGYISFTDDGTAIFSSDLKAVDLKAMGIHPGQDYKIRIINDDHLRYIRYHRTNVFQKK